MQVALLRNSRLRSDFPLPRLGLSHANDLGRAEGREAVHQCDADLDFGGLAIGVSCGDALPKGFEAAHLCLDATSDMVSGPAFPERPAGLPPPSGPVLMLVHGRPLVYRDDAFGRWWTVSQSAVRSDSIIVTPPPLDQDLGLA